jgi:HK97 family phage prohead protease
MSRHRRAAKHYRYRKGLSVKSAATAYAADSAATGTVYKDPLYIESPLTHSRNADGDLIIEGFVSTKDIDGHGEIVLPTAFAGSIAEYMATNPILLFDHDTGRPVGNVIEAQIESEGVRIKACIDSGETDVTRKIEKNILRTLSFGFTWPDYDDVEFKEMPDGRVVMVLTAINWCETSIAPVPSNKHAIFSMAKAFKTEYARKSLAIAQATPPTLTPQPQLPQEELMYTKEFKQRLGLAETATDAECEAALADLVTKKATIGTLEAENQRLKLAGEKSADEAFLLKWAGKIDPDVLLDIKSMSNRDAFAEKLVAKGASLAAPAPPAAPQSIPLPVGNPLQGAALAAAPSLAPTAGAPTEDDMFVLKGLGLCDSFEMAREKALTAPFEATAKVLGVKRLGIDGTQQMYEKQAVASRRAAMGLPAQG